MSQNKRKIEERKKLRKDGQGDDVCEACSAICHFESACPFFDARKREGEGQKDGGRAKKVDREKGGQGGDVRYSFSLSHVGLLSLLGCLEIRERQRNK